MLVSILNCVRLPVLAQRACESPLLPTKSCMCVCAHFFCSAPAGNRYCVPRVSGLGGDDTARAHTHGESALRILMWDCCDFSLLGVLCPLLSCSLELCHTFQACLSIVVWQRFGPHDEAFYKV